MDETKGQDNVAFVTLPRTLLSNRIKAHNKDKFTYDYYQWMMMNLFLSQTFWLEKKN